MNHHIIRSSSRTAVTRRQIVEQVEAFLQARRAETIPIAHLCHVVGVSERSLRNAFYDVRGMSPKQYVMRSRLDEVRRALRDARGNVTTIATDYGFFELGRFAGAYKAVYGETPSATLRRSGTATEMARAS